MVCDRCKEEVSRTTYRVLSSGNYSESLCDRCRQYENDRWVTQGGAIDNFQYQNSDGSGNPVYADHGNFTVYPMLQIRDRSFENINNLGAWRIDERQTFTTAPPMMRMIYEKTYKSMKDQLIKRKEKISSQRNRITYLERRVQEQREEIQRIRSMR